MVSESSREMIGRKKSSNSDFIDNSRGVRQRCCVVSSLPDIESKGGKLGVYTGRR